VPGAVAVDVAPVLAAVAADEPHRHADDGAAGRAVREVLRDVDASCGDAALYAIRSKQ